MGAILEKGFAQAQVHTNHSTSAVTKAIWWFFCYKDIRSKVFFTMATLSMSLIGIGVCSKLENSKTKLCLHTCVDIWDSVYFGLSSICWFLTEVWSRLENSATKLCLQWVDIWDGVCFGLSSIWWFLTVLECVDIWGSVFRACPN